MTLPLTYRNQMYELNNQSYKMVYDDKNDDRLAYSGDKMNDRNDLVYSDPVHDDKKNDDHDN